MGRAPTRPRCLGGRTLGTWTPRLGLAVGISSGANFLGAVLAQNRWGSDAVVVTVFPDSNKKYLSTDLVRDEPLREGYLSPDVELLGLEALGRTCRMCWDTDAY